MNQSKTIVVLHEDPDMNFQTEVLKNWRIPIPTLPIIQIIESSVDDIYKDFTETFKSNTFKFNQKYKMSPKSFQWIIKEAKANIKIYEKMKKIVFTIEYDGLDGMARSEIEFASFEECNRDTAYNKMKNSGYYSKREHIVDTVDATIKAKAKLDALDCLLLNIKK